MQRLHLRQHPAGPCIEPVDLHQAPLIGVVHVVLVPSTTNPALRDAAPAQGYSEDEGLDVVLEPPVRPEDPPLFVASGRVDIGISYEPDVIQARAQGIPIIAIAAIVPVPLNSIQTLKTSGLTHPSQLAGKTIGYPGIPSNRVYLQTVLRNVGVDPSSVKLVNVGLNLAPALRGNRADAPIGPHWTGAGVDARGGCRVGE